MKKFIGHIFIHLHRINWIQISKGYGLLYLLLGAAYLNLVMSLPATLMPGAMHDDGLFIKLAKSIVHFKWLGSYDQLTLSKGPGFPMLLAINYYLTTPITLFMGILYVFACARFSKAMYLVTNKSFFVFCLYFLLIFHPSLYPTRIIRDMVYPSFVLLMLVPFIEYPFKKPKIDFYYALRFSVPTFFFWSLREEGVWVIPGLAIYLIAIWFLMCQNIDKRKAFFGTIGLIGLNAACFVFLVASLNYFKYGAFELVDFKGGAFSKAIKKLSSVDDGQEIPFLPVSKEKRTLIYEVSPAFSELKEFFENSGKGWTVHGCSYYPATCGDYAFGWFLWALRDGTQRLGYYKDAKSANNFYDRISSEIDRACASTLKCKENPIPLMPVISFDQAKQIPSKFYNAIQISFLKPGSGPPIEEPSHGSAQAISEAKFFLRNPLVSNTLEESKRYISGWYFSPQKFDWPYLNCSDGKSNFELPVRRRESLDLVGALGEASANLNRFSLEIPFSYDCSVMVAGKPSSLRFEDLRLGKHALGQGFLYIDSIEEFSGGYSKKLLKIKALMIKIYSVFLPWMLVLGSASFIGIFILAIISKSGLLNFVLLPTLFGALYCSRLALLALIDVSSFPAVQSIYVSASFPLLIVFSLTSVLFLISFIKSLADKKFFLKKD